MKSVPRIMSELRSETTKTCVLIFLLSRLIGMSKHPFTFMGFLSAPRSVKNGPSLFLGLRSTGMHLNFSSDIKVTAAPVS